MNTPQPQKRIGWIAKSAIALGITSCVVFSEPPPFGDSKDSYVIQAYKYYYLHTTFNEKGISLAQELEEYQKASERANAEIAQIDAKAQAGVTAVITASAGGILTGKSNVTAQSLTTLFQTTVKKSLGNIDAPTLNGYTQKFAQIASRLDTDGDGRINDDERFQLANSAEFIHMMEEMKASQAQKTFIIGELLPKQR